MRTDDRVHDELARVIRAHAPSFTYFHPRKFTPEEIRGMALLCQAIQGELGRKVLLFPATIEERVAKLCQDEEGHFLRKEIVYRAESDEVEYEVNYELGIMIKPITEATAQTTVRKGEIIRGKIPTSLTGRISTCEAVSDALQIPVAHGFSFLEAQLCTQDFTLRGFDGIGESSRKIGKFFSKELPTREELIQTLSYLERFPLQVQ